MFQWLPWLLALDASVSLLVIWFDLHAKFNLHKVRVSVQRASGRGFYDLEVEQLKTWTEDM